MKIIAITLLAVSLALAGCATDGDTSGESTTGSNGNTGGGGSEVHGTVEVTNNTTPPTSRTA